MDSERTKILEMVAKAVITPEQGDQLLEALERQKARSSPPEQALEGPRRSFELTGGFTGLPDSTLRDLRRQVRRGIRVRPSFGPRIVVRGGDIWGRGWSTGRKPVKDSDFEHLIELATLGIGPDYIRKMLEAGLEDLTAEQAMELGAMGVSPEFVKEMTEYGADIDYDGILELGALGINASYIRRCREAGLEGLTTEKLLQMGALGVKPESFKEMMDLYASDAEEGSPSDEGDETPGPGSDRG